MVSNAGPEFTTLYPSVVLDGTSGKSKLRIAMDIPAHLATRETVDDSG